MSGSSPSLPPEILLSIIDHVVSPTVSQHLALRASHPVTKTLLSLARVSSLTYPVARRLLFTHCLWIEDVERLRSLMMSLTRPSPGFYNSPLFIRPHIPAIEQMTSLYLSYSEIRQPDSAKFLDLLFHAIAPYLRHLVIDMPLRDWDHDGDDEAEIRQTRKTQATLRRAFSQLTMLETFCSIRDELFLPTYPRGELGGYTVGERTVWPLWSNLKTLALYNQDVMGEDFWEKLGKLKYLETLVLTRADGLMDTDMKQSWRRHCGVEKRGLDIVLVNVENYREELRGSERWKEDEISVRELDVGTSYYGDEDEIELCQEWVKRRVLRGVEPRDWNSALIDVF